jgi:Fe-S-cluster containining protein
MSCTGRCCAVFPVGGLSYRELEERYYAINDGATIFDMVRPLTRTEAVRRRVRFGLDVHVDEPQYRCVRWDEQTGLCTRYDERPEMCHAYPYNHECDHGCGHTEPLHTRLVWAAMKCPGTWRGRWPTSRTPYVGGVTALTLPG